MHCHLYLEVQILNEQKLIKLLEFYKQYKALSGYIDKKYKLTLNDLAVLYLAKKYCLDERILMQTFLKLATGELDISRTKILMSIRRLIDKEKLNKVRSNRDERKIFLYMDEGEFISIMGPSGSGKTTLLNVLSSIDYMTKGSITINGKQLEKLSNKQLSDIRKKDIGFIFQDYNLLNTLTVKENIMLPLSVQKLDKQIMHERYQRIVEALNISDISDKYPSELSGGQRQRTSAARAFINLPSIIFADEPTGALDSKSTQDLLKRLKYMNEEFNTTILMVTHDPVAASFSNRVVMLKDGQIFTELYQGDDDKQTFYKEIIRTQSVLGGINYEL